jgi:hypothetical protein
MTVKNIFQEIKDDSNHDEFVKFSRGEFKNRYLINSKKQANKYAIKTSYEFANFLVKSCLKHVDDSVKITGLIATTLDLKDVIDFDISKISQFQGVKKYIINTTAKRDSIISLIDKYPRAFFAISFKGNDFDLKIKNKSPQSGKPKGGEDEPKVDFCTLKTDDKKILDEFFFDTGVDFKEIKINHTILVKNIIYPKDINGLKPAEIREQSKREGIITRNINIDGKIIKKDIHFIC